MEGDARTRDLVLRRVSELGPVTATRLAEEFGMTSAGVRRHVEALADDGLIAPSDVVPAKRGRGRPAKAYVVTHAGHSHLSTGYGDVATEALQFLADRLGDEAVADFARDRLAVLEARYAPVVEAAGEDLVDRAQALAEALAADGYAASARPVGPSGLGLQLCQGHCPMHEVAARFPQFCEEETEVFARLLGVHVQRLATLAGGEHVCTTFVPREPVLLGPLERPPGAATSGGDRRDQTTPTTEHHAHGHDERSAT
nr:HTH domain-containing protein [Mobilicoccus sp.]